MAIKDYSNIVINARKKKKEDDNKTSHSSGVKDYTSVVQKSMLGKTIDFDTFEADLNSLGSTVQGIYDTWQTQDTMSKTKTTVEAMQARINAYQEYQKMFGGADLSELANSYKSALDNWDNVSTLYRRMQILIVLLRKMQCSMSNSKDLLMVMFNPN